MRSMVESEERQGDADVTLGMASLLGIFLGLVVLCGVFFGFGYSVGKRGNTLASVRSTTSSTLPQAADAAGHQALVASKPSAGGAVLPQEGGSAEPVTGTAPEASTQASGATARPGRVVGGDAPGEPPVRSQPPVGSRIRREPSSTFISPSAAPPPPVLPSSAVPVGSPGVISMVQIAAVSHPADAEVLITALRKRGYNVSARNEAQDKLLHVQIGPFNTRAEANAMRQKLLADGYNAIVK